MSARGGAQSSVGLERVVRQVERRSRGRVGCGASRARSVRVVRRAAQHAWHHVHRRVARPLATTVRVAAKHRAAVSEQAINARRSFVNRMREARFLAACQRQWQRRRRSVERHASFDLTPRVIQVGTGC